MRRNKQEDLCCELLSYPVFKKPRRLQFLQKHKILWTNRDNWSDEMITSFLLQKYNLAIFYNLELFYEGFESFSLYEYNNTAVLSHKMPVVSSFPEFNLSEVR